MLDAHPSSALACQMEVGHGSHGLSAKGTKDEVKRPKGWYSGPGGSLLGTP